MTIDVSNGSVVAVDPDSLRAAAARLDGVAAALERAVAAAHTAADLVAANPDVSSTGPTDAAVLAALCRGRVAEHAAALRHAADVYELAELCFRAMLLAHPAVARGDGLGNAVPRAGGEVDPIAAERREVIARWRELGRENPEAFAEARESWMAWRREHSDEAIAAWGEAADGLPLPPFLGAPGIDWGTALGEQARGMVAALGVGVIPAALRLRGRGDPVRVATTFKAGGVSAPGSLRQAAGRIPDGATGARVRVETYAMPDGTREHVVYLAGTQGAGKDAWDWKSNLDLYRNKRSASYNGLEKALEKAGVKPGEPVHEVGFSQGAMVASRLALEGDYDVRSLIGFGSPVDIQGHDDMLRLSVRHTDDLVPMLADGGNPVEGVVVEKEYDPSGGVHDVALPAHRVDAYAETAGEIDLSEDPRLDELDALFTHLGTADEVVASEYSVTREPGAPATDPAVPAKELPRWRKEPVDAG